MLEMLVVERLVDPLGTGMLGRRAGGVIVDSGVVCMHVSVSLRVAMAVSALIFLAGVIMFGISLIRSGVYPKVAGWLFMVGFVFIPLVEVVGEPLVVIGSIVAGVSVFWLSYVLWSEAGGRFTPDVPTRETVPTGGVA